MKKLSLLLASIFLVSCNEVDGVLEVVSDFTLQGKKAELLIGEGRHDASLKFRNDDHLQLKMIVDGKKEKISFKLNRDYDFPSNNGSFSIPAEDNSQAVDIVGNVKSEYEDGRRRVERETCEYTEYRRRCRTTPRGRRICDNVPVRVRGWRDVHFYYEYKDQEINLYIAREGDDKAHFNSKHRYRRKYVQHRGICR